MYANVISVPYQVFYTLVPTVSIIGNSFIIYVTIRSRSLRTPCNILIGVTSFSNISYVIGPYVMLISHNITEDHRMRQDFCVYWRIVPCLGLILSSLLLLSLAFDRLLSVKTFYSTMIERHKYFYLAIQIFTPFLIVVAIGYLIFADRTPNEGYSSQECVPIVFTRIVCVITTPIHGTTMTLVLCIATAANTLIILCYTFLFRIIKQSQSRPESITQLYRSLIVVSLTEVFGWSIPILIGIITNAMNAKIERPYVSLLSNIFMTSACSLSFFVYYAISKEYRNAFDKYLYLHRLKQCGRIGNLKSVVNSTAIVVTRAADISLRQQISSMYRKSRGGVHIVVCE